MSRHARMPGPKHAYPTRGTPLTPASALVMSLSPYAKPEKKQGGGCMKADDPRTWKLARGKGELVKHLDGKQLTASQGIRAKCYECTGAFDAGKDCMVPDCPLYQFLPYGNWGTRKKRQMSPTQKATLQNLARRRSLQRSPSESNDTGRINGLGGAAE
jgi:hypothetical protein